MQECKEWGGGSAAERMMISRCVNWMWRWSRVCVCAVWLIGLPLTLHFHYLIAWKGRRGDCRSLAVRAKRMDLECISIGSKAPAVGSCPRPLGPSWKCRWAVPPPALAAPRPPRYFFIIALASLKGLPTALGPTHGAARSCPLILMFTGNSDLPHAPL